MASPVLIHMEKLKLRAGNTLFEFMQDFHQALSLPSSSIWAWWEPGWLRGVWGLRPQGRMPWSTSLLNIMSPTSPKSLTL